MVLVLIIPNSTSDINNQRVAKQRVDYWYHECCLVLSIPKPRVVGIIIVECFKWYDVSDFIFTNVESNRTCFGIAPNVYPCKKITNGIYHTSNLVWLCKWMKLVVAAY